MSIPGGFQHRDFFDKFVGSETVTFADGANAASAVSFDVALTNVAVEASENGTYTLPSGSFPGQIKRFVATSIGASGDVTISGAIGAYHDGDATGDPVSVTYAAKDLTFDADDEYADIMWTGARWVILASTAA